MCSYLTISESGSGTGEKIWFTEVLSFDSEIPQPAMNQVKEFAMMSSASAGEFLCWSEVEVRTCQGSLHWLLCKGIMATESQR